jgi:hypothetical protein
MERAERAGGVCGSEGGQAGTPGTCEGSWRDSGGRGSTTARGIHGRVGARDGGNQDTLTLQQLCG